MEITTNTLALGTLRATHPVFADHAAVIAANSVVKPAFLTDREPVDRRKKGGIR
ncbi:MAG: hypothetical protein R8G34_16490 [Paracoccaceae bacterium]|nr:hypothetical protein [Paracoccaceae bacterium]